MYTLPELSQRRPKQNRSVRRLCFTIFYLRHKAFELAADTWKRSVVGQEQLDLSTDVFFKRGVETQRQFRDVWTEIADLAGNNFTVWAGGLFTHASKLSSSHKSGGLEFAEVCAPGGMQCVDGTMSGESIEKLPRLNWDESGYLMLCSCNSGLGGNKSIGARFSNSQRVTTIAQAGNGYFSRKWDHYLEIFEPGKEAEALQDRFCASSQLLNTSLWAYERMRNGFLGSARRMPGKVFTPR